MPPRPAPTHFLCIPLVTPTSRPQLSESLAAFKADVTSLDSFAIPKDAVRPLGTLHLTLGVMSFPRNEGLDRAVQVLRTLKPREILSAIRSLSSRAPLAGSAPDTNMSKKSRWQQQQQQPLSLTLRSLHSVQPAHKASVLYAPPIDADGVFRAFCERLRGVFQEANVMEKEDRPLLLHATIVNTIYVKGRGSNRGARVTIDARDILDRYDDYIWMENVPVGKIAICRMGAKKIEGVDDQEYEVEAEIEF